MNDAPLRAGREGVVLSVHVQPGARREGLAGIAAQRLRVKVAPPAEDGRANERLIEVVARAFGLKRGAVTLVSGATSRRKDLALSGLSLEAARARLEAALEGETAA